MARPIPTFFFALVAVRLGHRFLLVQERRHGGTWYLPAGRSEPGESLAETAVREAYEEAGIPVRLDGVLRVEHSTHPEGGARVRALFLAHPMDDSPLKEVPDDESLGAAWWTLDEIAQLQLRQQEVLRTLREIEAGAPVYPLSIIRPEGEPLLG